MPDISLALTMSFTPTPYALIHQQKKHDLEHIHLRTSDCKIQFNDYWPPWLRYKHGI
jgi:hypothetical protein